ncbi:hypothetical protein TWF694_006316 [Orbilia ellipsospora]|uniref:Uncharacterized protein n=1 Tax=Orbilia ellipsospora TaxID=2528407 RepID=A0AAV9XJU9_9PEZI
MNPSDAEKPPKYEDSVRPPTTTTTMTSSSNSERPSGLENMIESSGLGDAARRIEGAGEYLRHTLLAQVDRFAGDSASADEKDRLANRGYDQMTTGKRGESSSAAPPVTEYYAPGAPGGNINPGAVNDWNGVDKKE